VRYRVTHTTTYAYEEIVSIGHNEVRLEPRTTPRQRCLETVLAIDPTPAVRATGLDYFGNPTSFFTVQEPHPRMVLVAQSELEIDTFELPEATPPWEELCRRLRHDRSAGALAAYEMSFESPLVPLAAPFAAYAAPSFEPGRLLLDAVLDLTRRIHAEFEYRPGATSVTTPVGAVLEQRSGVCQDFAHVEIACLRALGLPARYVSGYVRTQRVSDERDAGGGELLVGGDASHAWVSVWMGDAGWVDVDPTNDLVASDQHLTLAWGRDYGDVAPIKGVILGGGGHSVEVAVAVDPLADADEDR
jgi:transglutaminase-like putative cysteine protease